MHTEAVRAVLVESGYASGTVAAHLGLLRLLDAACAREQVGLDGLTDAGIEELLVGVAVAGRPVTLRRLGPVLIGLRAAGVIPASTRVSPDAVGRLVEAYVEFLLGQRRLAASTAQHRGELATRFLQATATAHGSGWDIGELQVGDLHGFLFDYASRSSVGGTAGVNPPRMRPRTSQRRLGRIGGEPDTEMTASRTASLERLASAVMPRAPRSPQGHGDASCPLSCPFPWGTRGHVILNRDLDYRVASL